MLYVLASLVCCFQAKNLNVQILWPVGFIIYGKPECFGVLSCGIQKLDILVYIFKKRNGPNHVDPFLECNESGTKVDDFLTYISVIQRNC